jgi:hypothetical protein
MTDRAEPETRRKAGPGKKWVGGEIDEALYDELSKIAKADMVPMTVVMRWALADFVAGRKQT